MKHFYSKYIKSSTTSIPTSRNNHRKVSRIQFHCLLYKMVIYGDCTSSVSSVIQLIWWITYDNVKLHVSEYFFWFVCVNKLICVALQVITNCLTKDGLRSTTVFTFSINERMLYRPESEIAFLTLKTTTNRVWPVGFFTAINRTATGKCRQFRNGYAIELMGKNVVGTFVNVRNLCLQTNHQPLGYFTKKNATLADRVEKLGFFAAKQLRRKHIEHTVHNLRGCENLIVRQVGQTGQNVWIVIIA